MYQNRSPRKKKENSDLRCPKLFTAVNPSKHGCTFYAGDTESFTSTIFDAYLRGQVQYPQNFVPTSFKVHF
jgi:hypothetical protein